jgi:hypothetical protein
MWRLEQKKIHSSVVILLTIKRNLRNESSFSVRSPTRKYTLVELRFEEILCV